jgi:hypothetical protein
MKGLAALFITLFAFTVVNSQVPKTGYDPIALFPRLEQIQEFVKGTDPTDDAAREYAVLNYLWAMTQNLYLHGPLMKNAPEFFKQRADHYGNEFMKNRKTLSDESKSKYRNDLILLDDVMRHFFRTDLQEYLYKINHMTAPPRPELSPKKNGRLKN